MSTSIPGLAEARGAAEFLDDSENLARTPFADLQIASAEEVRQLACELLIRLAELEQQGQDSTRELAAANRRLQCEIYQRAAAEAALMKQNQLMGEILQNMPVVAFQIDGDGRVQQSVGAGLARLGRQDNESVGKRMADIQPESREWIDRALSGENVHFQSEGTNGGKPYAFESFVAFDNVRGSGAVGFAIDVTERMEAEEREDQLRHELAHLARVKTMGEMASGIAHELNQPLAAILMQAEVAAHKLRHQAKQTTGELLDTLDRIADQAHRAGEIIRHMKEFVQKAQPYRVAIGLAEVVGEVAALVRNDLRHAGVRFDVEMDEALPMILGDKIQLQQVLLNLIRNAMEAMESTEADARRLRLCARVHEEMLEVTVSDTGCGVPDGRFDQLFGAFCSTKSGGMGMGLAIGRSVVEAHGGRIWATNNRRRGTAFVFTLPIAREDCEHGS